MGIYVYLHWGIGGYKHNKHGGYFEYGVLILIFASKKLSIQRIIFIELSLTDSPIIGKVGL